MMNDYDMMRAKTHWCLLLMLGLLFLGTPTAFAQEAPEFEVDAISVRSKTLSKTRLDLYTSVPYSRLSFLNTSNGFTAQYDVSVEVFPLTDRRRRGNLVQTRLWESTVIVPTFVETKADFYDYTTHSLDLPPGRYLLEFKLEDQDTREAFVHELEVAVHDLSSPVAISDIILLKEYDADTKTIYPSISNRVNSEDFDLEVFYEVYTDRSRTVQVTREVARLNNPTDGVTATRALSRDENLLADAKIVQSSAEKVVLESGRQNQAIVPVTLENLDVGDYMLRVRIADEQGRPLAHAERAFAVEWTGLADHVSNLDDAISQLQYIAKSKDLRRIREAQTRSEKLQLFEDFWNKRDPTNGTQRNERMEEYYYRIAFANREYGSLTDGWKTDRGQVMVLFGEPDYVERHPYDFNNKPYQIWYYYRIGKKFIFIDDTGFGDFKLMVPIWDDRTRIR